MDVVIGADDNEGLILGFKIILSQRSSEYTCLKNLMIMNMYLYIYLYLYIYYINSLYVVPFQAWSNTAFHVRSRFLVKYTASRTDFHSLSYIYVYVFMGGF